MFFFFKQKTSYEMRISDWSSDVCSSDLLLASGLTPVLIGRAAERAQIDEILAHCPEAVNLCDRTSIADLAMLGRRAALAVGHDTGPMHVIAHTGCPSLVLYSAESDPRKVSPRRDWIRLVPRPRLQALPLQDTLPASPPRTAQSQPPTPTRP